MPVQRSSIRRNIFANSVAQLYVMLIGIAMAPVYLSYLGAEAYGLIGFFTMMSAWFQLLDLGLTPTLMRETARFRGGAVSVDGLRALLRALEVVFGGVSLAGAIALVLLAHPIATQWLNVRHLPIEDVSRAVMLMGLTVPLRWCAGLYRGVIGGFERQVWLGGFNIAIATARFLGVLLVFATFGATPVHFFVYQLAIAASELVGLMIATYRLVHRGDARREAFSWKPLAGNLVFSLTIAASATIWITVAQADRLILSKMLPLAEFGVFSIAVVAAGAINAANAPFNQALLPRLSKLAAENNEQALVALYRTATQAVCVIMVPAVVLLVIFAEKILFVWTGNVQIARHAAPILALYAIGNGCVSLNSFAYYIQYARGDLKLHIIGHALLLLLLVPAYFWAAPHYGAVGTGTAWAAVNALYTLAWIPAVHARVLKGHHWSWLVQDVLIIAVPTALVGFLAASAIPASLSRTTLGVEAALLGMLLLGVAGAGSSAVRREARTFLRALLSGERQGTA